MKIIEVKKETSYELVCKYKKYESLASFNTEKEAYAEAELRIKDSKTEYIAVIKNESTIEILKEK